MAAEMIRFAVPTLIAIRSAGETAAALRALLDRHQAGSSAQGGSLGVPDDATAPAFLLRLGDPALVLDSRKLSC